MTKYQNKQNGKVMEIIGENNEAKTYKIKFEDGTTKDISVSTFKRWYKAFEVPETVENLIDLDNPVTEEEAEQFGMIGGDEALEQAVVDPDTAYVAEVMKQKAELGIECPEITSYEEVTTEPDGAYAATDYMHNLIEQAGKEEVKQVKEKAVKKTRQTKEAQAWVEDAKQYVFGLVQLWGDEVFVPNNIPMRSFKVGGHMYARFNFSKSSVTLGLKSSSIQEGVKAPDGILNHMFNAVYNFKSELTTDDKELIMTLLAGARAQRVAKNDKQAK